MDSARVKKGRAKAHFLKMSSPDPAREFGHGDLFLTREEAEAALADVLRDEPDLERFLSVEALPLPQPSRN